MGSKRLSIIVGGREPIMAMIGQLVAIFSANKHPLSPHHRHGDLSQYMVLFS
jgi:hypothetical protein